MSRISTALPRLAAALLVIAAVTVSAAGCAIVPAGYGPGYGYAAGVAVVTPAVGVVAPVVVAPRPVIVSPRPRPAYGYYYGYGRVWHRGW